MRSRIQEAVNMFEAGYNCCQSVFATYADIFGLDRETAIRMTSSMGAGIGRMREVCGTVSAMALLVGLKEGSTQIEDATQKTKIYEMVREMSDTFSGHSGSIVCRELLGLSEREESAKPDERTSEYYNKRPCTKLVAEAAKLIEENLLEDIVD